MDMLVLLTKKRTRSGIMVMRAAQSSKIIKAIPTRITNVRTLASTCLEQCVANLEISSRLMTELRS